MTRVYTLYRVSTVGQVDHDDIPMQRIACHEFAQQQGDWEIVNELYEKGVSGYKVSTDKRDAISQLKVDALAFVQKSISLCFSDPMHPAVAAAFDFSP